MNQDDVITKSTLADALNWDDAEFKLFTDGGDARDFDFSFEECAATSSLWLYLTGIEPGSALAAVAIDELLESPDIFIKLNSPAMVFIEWFRRDDWHSSSLCYEGLTDTVCMWGIGSVEWALNVLIRAGSMRLEMGKLADHDPLRVPVA